MSGFLPLNRQCFAGRYRALWMKPQVLWSLQGYSPLSVAKKARELGVGHKFVLVKESLKKYLVNLVCNIPSGKLT